MNKKKHIKQNVVLDFIKASNCAYSITLNLVRALGKDPDPVLLSSVLGFSAGVSTLGDTCGTVNSGIIALGDKYAGENRLDNAQFYMVCSECFHRLEQRLDTPDCGKVHGGKHLANNFRRAILTGKPLKCIEILKHGTDVIRELDQQVQNDFHFDKLKKYTAINTMAQHFEQQNFHCCQSVIKQISEHTDMDCEKIFLSSKGFAGGIGFNGTMCGAIAGGILSLGLKAGVDLSNMGYKDTFKTMMIGLAISDGFFRSEKYFPAAKLFGQCQQVYQLVENNFSGPHCSDILGLKLNTEEGGRQYISENKVEQCREIVNYVSDTVIGIWEIKV